MEISLLLVYLWMIIFSICLFGFVILFGFFILIIFRKDPDESYLYLKNMVYAIFGGIVAVIVYETKGKTLDFSFFAFLLPLTITASLIFILFGFLYLYILKRIYLWIKSGDKIQFKIFKSKMTKLKDEGVKEKIKFKVITQSNFLNIKHPKILLIILVIIIILLSIWSVELIRKNSAPDISLPYKENRFVMEGLNNKIVRDVFLYYDFDKNKGSFKFRTAGVAEVDQLSIEIPDSLNITDYNVTYSDNNSIVNSSLINEWISGATNNTMRLAINKIGKDEGVEILVNFTSPKNNFYPNGRFIFSFNGASEVTLNDDSVEEHYGSLLKFDLGKGYRCQAQCFIPEKMSNESLNAFPNYNWIIVSTDGNSRNIGNVVVFTISTFNAGIQENANLMLNVGISLLAGIMLGIIFFLLERLW